MPQTALSLRLKKVGPYWWPFYLLTMTKAVGLEFGPGADEGGLTIVVPTRPGPRPAYRLSLARATQAHWPMVPLPVTPLYGMSIELAATPVAGLGVGIGDGTVTFLPAPASPGYLGV